MVHLGRAVLHTLLLSPGTKLPFQVSVLACAGTQPEESSCSAPLSLFLLGAGVLCCKTLSQVNTDFMQTDKTHGGSFWCKRTRVWVGWGSLGVQVSLSIHPLCLPQLPKRHLHPPAQYQKDAVAQNQDSPARGKDHVVLV